MREADRCDDLERHRLDQANALDRVCISREARAALKALQRAEQGGPVNQVMGRQETSDIAPPDNHPREAGDLTDSPVAVAVPQTQTTMSDASTQSPAALGSVETATAAAGNANVFSIAMDRSLQMNRWPGVRRILVSLSRWLLLALAALGIYLALRHWL